MTGSLFPEFDEAETSIRGAVNSDPVLPAGAVFRGDFLEHSEAHHLVDSLDQEPWITDLKRRVQHYGYRYDYQARRVNFEDRIGDLPSWCQDLASRVGTEFFQGNTPDQLIINEYQGAQGIAPHVDCEPCFMDGIITISLLEPCRMDFVHLQSSEKLSCILPPGSLLLMAGESRYDWTHGIRPNKNTVLDDGTRISRDRRLSLTFRRVILEQ